MPTRVEVDEALKVLPVPRPTLRGLSLVQAEAALAAWKAAIKQVHRDLIKQAHPDVAGAAGADQARKLNDARAVLLSVAVRPKRPKPPAPPPAPEPAPPMRWYAPPPPPPMPRWDAPAALAAVALAVSRVAPPVASYTPRWVLIGRLW